MKPATFVGLLAALAGAATGAAAAGKATQFWNLISSQVTRLEISKVGAGAFGPNQTANDPDGAVDHDERLRITGVDSGTYDLRLTLKDGRICLAKNVAIQAGKAFSLEDKDLVDCVKR